MRIKRTIKAKQPQLRGSKLSWTESGKLHSTVKRLANLISEDRSERMHGTRKKIVCPRCLKRLIIGNNGRIPTHKPRGSFHGTGDCIDNQMRPIKLSSVKKTLINDIEFKAGDVCIYQPYPWHQTFNVERSTLLEVEIEYFALMSNSKTKIKFKNDMNLYPMYMFKLNNLIKK